MRANAGVWQRKNGAVHRGGLSRAANFHRGHVATRHAAAVARDRAVLYLGFVELYGHYQPPPGYGLPPQA